MMLERQAPAKFYFARNTLLCTPNGRKNAGRHDTHDTRDDDTRGHDTRRHDTRRHDPGKPAHIGPDRRDAPARHQGLPVRRNATGGPHEPRVPGRNAGRKLRSVDRRGRLGIPDRQRPVDRRCRGSGDARCDQHGPREGLTGFSFRTSGRGDSSRRTPCPGRARPWAR